MRAFSGRVGWDIRMLWSAFLKLLKPARLWCRLGCVWKALEWSLPLQSTRQCAAQSFLMVSSDCQIKTKYGNIFYGGAFSKSKFESYQFSSSAVWGWRLLWQRCQRCLRAHTEEKYMKYQVIVSKEIPLQPGGQVWTHQYSHPLDWPKKWSGF